MSSDTKPPQRVAYTTFGCRLNQYDTESIRTLLERSGEYQTVEPSADADIYVVNTCSVTARADATARKAIRRLHDKYPGARIVVMGCYAQRAPQEIAELPGVSLIMGIIYLIMHNAFSKMASLSRGYTHVQSHYQRF